MLSILAAFAVAASLPSPAAARTVCVVPLGRHDAALADLAVRGIRGLFGLDAKVLPGVPMPRSAWYAPRGRWRAERLLDFLDRAADGHPGCDRFVGLTSLDISTTKGDRADWGIFGLGAIGGRSCVVSTLRLSRKGVPAATVRDRTVKVVNHELGHVLGLDHCPVPGCLMHDAEGTVRTVDGEDGTPCAACRERLGRAVGRQLPARFDWGTVR
jgi:archaemetzincin